MVSNKNGTDKKEDVANKGQLTVNDLIVKFNSDKKTTQGSKNGKRMGS
jgi:hypothetical protein